MEIFAGEIDKKNVNRTSFYNSGGTIAEIISGNLARNYFFQKFRKKMTFPKGTPQAISVSVPEGHRENTWVGLHSLRILGCMSRRIASFAIISEKKS